MSVFINMSPQQNFIFMVLCMEQARHKSVSTHFSSPDPKGHLKRYCHHCMSISFLSSSVYLYILVFLSKTTGPIGHTLQECSLHIPLQSLCCGLSLTGNPPQKQKATRCQNGCFLFLYVVHLCLTNYDYFHDVPYRILYVVCQRFV